MGLRVHIKNNFLILPEKPQSKCAGYTGCEIIDLPVNKVPIYTTSIAPNSATVVIDKLEVRQFPLDFGCADEDRNRQRREAIIPWIRRIQSFLSIIYPIVICIGESRVTA